MEIESFESGYPSGDVNQWSGFWSYNQEIGYAPTSGLIKNGQLVINNGGTESFFFKRASGAISSSLLSQAEGVGFYVKNNTKSPVRLAFYGAGDKDKKDNGEAMFFFPEERRHLYRHAGQRLHPLWQGQPGVSGRGQGRVRPFQLFRFCGRLAR